MKLTPPELEAIERNHARLAAIGDRGRTPELPDIGDTRTTRQKLDALGYTTKDAGQYRKKVFLMDTELFEGTAHEIECWLAKGGGA